MKIRTKLLLGLSPAPILILLLIVMGVFQLSSLRDLRNTTTNNYQVSLLAEQIQTNIKNEAISLRNLTILDNEQDIKKELNNLQKESSSTEEKITLLNEKVDKPKQKVLVEKLTTTHKSFNTYKDEVIDLISQGKKQEAIDLIISNSFLLHNELSNDISELTSQLEAGMTTSFEDTMQTLQQRSLLTSVISLVCIILTLVFVVRTTIRLVSRIKKVSNVMMNVANGSTDLATRVEIIANDEIDEMGSAFNTMAHTLAEQIAKEQSLIWIKSNSADISTTLNGIHDLEALAQAFLSKVVPLMNAPHAVFYGRDEENLGNQQVYKLLASYAKMGRIEDAQNEFKLGEGLIGQAALEKQPILITDVPSNYIRVKSGLGEGVPLTIYVVPVLFEDHVTAVLEFALFKPISERQQNLIEEIKSSLGIILESVSGRIRLAKLLEETQVLMEEVQAQSEELQSQQEELRVMNEELEEQTQALRNSEQVLQSQQEELEQTNGVLKEKAKTLEERNRLLELTNLEVEKARCELEQKAEELAQSSKYKSEFLANMSHELRTPLNSLLILSKLLSDNQGGHLTEKQVHYAKTIYSSGNDLLALINDILDLAKIESGKMDVNPGRVRIGDLIEYVKNNFKPVADEKGLTFEILVKDQSTAYLYSDEQRIQQVLKNLLSNAFKFTQQGGVTLELGWIPGEKENQQSLFTFSVTDTGIGIQKDKLGSIFEAFQQADGTTSRRFGGTGLGLSICREIANLLNGEITAVSEEGKGSTFTFSLGDYQNENVDYFQAAEETDWVDDIHLEGKNVSERTQIGDVLDTVNLQSELLLPAKQEEYCGIKRILIVDDDLRQRNSLMELIGDMNVVMNAVPTGKEALEELKVNKFDCIILDLGLADTNGFALLEKIKPNIENDGLHVFIYTGRDLTSKEEIYLKKFAHTIIIKDSHSPKRLKEELGLYLQTNGGEEEFYQPTDATSAADLKGKRILLVDDDVRNVYALMSFLEQYQMDISFAENGQECLDIVKNSLPFDMILMDIMMPEMDGYEAIRRIREKPEFLDLPIIALTAKAMKEDREKCIEAGASDYIVKPFDPHQLISLIKVWIYQKKQEDQPIQ